MANLSKIFLNSARRSLAWFRESPIMDGGGHWGVGERLVLTHGNDAMAKIHERFPETTSHPDGLECLEQRRSDCNFETALLFYLAGEWLDSPADRQTARDLLDYLYFRSGLLNRMDNGLLYGGWALNGTAFTEATMRPGIRLWIWNTYQAKANFNLGIMYTKVLGRTEKEKDHAMPVRLRTSMTCQADTKKANNTTTGI